MATRRLNPAAWTEGMFLRPHHLQHLDLSAEERVLYHFRSANPFHYGLRSFALDEDESKPDDELLEDFGHVGVGFEWAL